MKSKTLPKKFHVMGILNITPDSFSDGGVYNELEKAYEKVAQMINDGATIIDVGGESTRPGCTFISQEEEIKRVIPIIKMIKENFQILVSIDTYKSEVAKKAIEAGADIINDVQANRYDGNMLGVVKETKAIYIAMHSNPLKSSDVIKEIEENFEKILADAKQIGLDPNEIILDPGIGFSKNQNVNLEILRNLKRLKADFKDNEFLLGTSRKRFIGSVTNVDEANKRVIGSVVTTVLAYQAGFQIVRVHDTCEHVQAVKMIEAVREYEY